MKHVAFPFHTIGNEHVVASPWTLLESDGRFQDLADHIPTWDYARDLRISRTIGLDKAIGGLSLGFGDDEVNLSALVRLGTGPGSLPRRTLSIFKAILSPDRPIVVDHLVPGETLSHRLWLETTIVLESATNPKSRFAPRRRGSVLWRDIKDIRLEGTSPRFPMEIISFTDRFAGRPESTALWYLHWRPGEMHRDFGGAVRLFLNHDNEEFMARFVAGDTVTLQCTLANVISQMLEHALREDGLEHILADSEPTSVAGHIATWLTLAFPGWDIARIRTTLERMPGQFHAAILAMADPQCLETAG